MPGPSGDPRLELASLRKQLWARTAQANDAEEKARVMRQRLSDMINEFQEAKQEKKDLIEELEKARQERTATTRLYRESQKCLARAKQVYDKEREEWDKKQSSLVAQCQNQLTKIAWLEKLLTPEEITNPPRDTDEMQGVTDNTSVGVELPALCPFMSSMSIRHLTDAIISHAATVAGARDARRRTTQPRACRYRPLAASYSQTIGQEAYSQEDYNQEVCSRFTASRPGKADAQHAESATRRRVRHFRVQATSAPFGWHTQDILAPL